MLPAAGLTLAFAGAAGFLAYRRHTSAVRRMSDRIIASGMQAGARRQTNEAALPPPVARYLRLALQDSAAEAPAAVALLQSGELRTDTSSARWMRFRATHVAAPLGSSFLWNATVRVAPFMHVRVLDSLVAGRGSGQALLQSLWPLACHAGTMQMNSGSLHRFLAEAVWYPWALLPSEHLQWEAIDDRQARATLTSASTTVTLDFRFAASGEVAGIYSAGRWGRFGSEYLQLPWEGRFANYERIDGLLLPRHGEVGWHRQGRLEMVWRGDVQSLRRLGEDTDG
jgi:hypothetical protein